MPVEIRKPGDVIEGYTVLSEIGRGAASIIYLVRDPKSKQVWALKHVSKDTPKDQRFLDQAEAEYKIAQEFDHSRIRKIDRLIKKRAGLLQVKELYLLMEFVDGPSVDCNPPETLEKSVLIFQQIADAMAHMHARGWVHADMKPNNIIVSDDEAKIIDLGQSCKIGTVKERIQGTPDYIAPEQVHRRAITPKTDIYNLGATMYWVLTRRHIPTALAKEDSLLGSLDDNMIARPQPVHHLCPNVHPILSELVMQCVEPSPDKRPATMHGVADKLNLVLGIVRAERESRSHDRENRKPEASQPGPRVAGGRAPTEA